MSNNFFRLSDKDSLEKLVTASNGRPVVVFKHSSACPISSRAYREMEKLDHVNLIEVQTARDVSNEIATLTGVRHETPQVIVLKDGKAVWNASHYDVSAQAVNEALEANR